MSDTRTITELESQRYHWIAAECCKGRVLVPFRMIHAAHPDWPLSDMTLDDIGPRLRCQHCGSRPKRYYAARQEDASGYARKF